MPLHEAWAWFDEGESCEAILEEAVSEIEMLKSKKAVKETGCWLAVAASAAKKLTMHEAAEGYACEAISTLSTANNLDHGSCAVAHLILAEVRAHAGGWSAALPLSLEAAAHARQADDERLLCSALLLSGRIQLKVTMSCDSGNTRSSSSSRLRSSSTASLLKILSYISEACSIARRRCDHQANVEGLLLASETHTLLYEYEEALRCAKEAVKVAEAAGAALPENRQQSALAAKEAVMVLRERIAVSQRAFVTVTELMRGCPSAEHRQKPAMQQRGVPPPDPFAAYGAGPEEEQDEKVEAPRNLTPAQQLDGRSEAHTTVAAAPSTAAEARMAAAAARATKGVHGHHADDVFMRKSFKWNEGRNSTDDAWYRQELRFLPPQEGW